MNKIIALIGNPNCGKTTLFNLLTKSSQRTGNMTGVTTDKKTSYIKGENIILTDLPGLYSLETKSKDEEIVRLFLKNDKPDLIINIVDGTNLQRNLYLTTELMECNIPIIIAVNHLDELESNNKKIDINYLEKNYGVPCITISALRNKNIDNLIKKAKIYRGTPKKLNLSVFKGYTKSEKIYSFIDSIISEITDNKTFRREKITLRIDRILTGKYSGIPIFVLVIFVVYVITIKLGGYLGGFIEDFFINFKNYIEDIMVKKAMWQWLTSLICDGIIKGFSLIISFLPQILILFFLMSLIEESGYASRIAYILDKILSKIGLSGKSIIPIIVSCGCTVTGIMATRTIENDSERNMTICFAPFMPCSAKTVVCAWVATKFFNGNSLVAVSMYFLGIVVIILSGMIMKGIRKNKGDKGDFILEMPLYRLPRIKNLVVSVWARAKEFLLKAGLTVVLLSVGLWILSHVGVRGYAGDNIRESFLYLTGNFLKYLFYPLGFGNWEATVSILSGIFAREAIIETLDFVCEDLTMLFENKFSAFAFLAFILLSPPCVATQTVIKNEIRNTKQFFLIILFQFVTAYITALIINLTGILVNNIIGLILFVVIVIIISGSIITYNIIKRKSNYFCKNKEKSCQKKENRFTI